MEYKKIIYGAVMAGFSLALAGCRTPLEPRYQASQRTNLPGEPIQRTNLPGKTQELNQSSEENSRFTSEYPALNAVITGDYSAIKREKTEFEKQNERLREITRPDNAPQEYPYLEQILNDPNLK